MPCPPSLETSERIPSKPSEDQPAPMPSSECSKEAFAFESFSDLLARLSLRHEEEVSRWRYRAESLQRLVLDLQAELALCPSGATTFTTRPHLVTFPEDREKEWKRESPIASKEVTPITKGIFAAVAPEEMTVTPEVTGGSSTPPTRSAWALSQAQNVDFNSLRSIAMSADFDDDDDDASELSMEDLLPRLVQQTWSQSIEEAIDEHVMVQKRAPHVDASNAEEEEAPCECRGSPSGKCEQCQQAEARWQALDGQRLIHSMNTTSSASNASPTHSETTDASNGTMPPPPRLPPPIVSTHAPGLACSSSSSSQVPNLVAPLSTHQYATELHHGGGSSSSSSRHNHNNGNNSSNANSPSPANERSAVIANIPMEFGSGTMRKSAFSSDMPEVPLGTDGAFAPRRHRRHSKNSRLHIAIEHEEALSQCRAGKASQPSSQAVCEHPDRVVDGRRHRVRPEVLRWTLARPIDHDPERSFAEHALKQVMGIDNAFERSTDDEEEECAAGMTGAMNAQV
mmetsp:Transcript_33931/g.72328  ORF Transcript_33931/g.72328 Transcript_33931/m.72328 type:complete len:512 (-) Transcript_33931:84-1619(-)